MSDIITEDRIYTALGFGGGCLLAFAQVPQVYHVYVRKSAGDISYAYQFTFAAGMAMFLVYYRYYERYSLLLPATASFACIVGLIALKTYLEILSPRRAAERAGRTRVANVDLTEALLADSNSDVREAACGETSDDGFVCNKTPQG